MKKGIFTLAASLLLIGGLTSCTKTYTCVCTYTYAGQEVVNESQTLKTTKEKAREMCELGTTINSERAECKLQ